MTFGLRTETLHLPLKDPFKISRERDSLAVTTVIVHLDRDGMDGIGEAFPVAYYGETEATIEVVLPRMLEAVQGLEPPAADLDAMRVWLDHAAAAMTASIGGHGGAKCGLDIALHDLCARARDLPLWQFLGTSPTLPATDYSLGIDEPEVVAERARAVANFPALKIKVGGPADLETLEAVRAVYAGPLRVDANTGWRPEQGAALIPELERLGVELVEQPFPAGQLPQLRWLQERSSLPIMADESAVFEEDLERLRGVVAGVVVKLVKCGGVGPALRMIRRAHELGMKVMLGCMVETSVGIAAAAAVASEADWLDLDGNLLLAADPFKGLELGADCRWSLPEAPGLGVSRSTGT